MSILRRVGMGVVGGMMLAMVMTALAGAEPHTKVQLVANVQSIKPGMPFLVGVRLTMDSGWHTYWKNPGEAGIPTEIRWTLPAGFAAAAPLWPVPEKHVEEGDVLTYGYGGETMAIVEVTPPRSLAVDERVTLTAAVSWLECANICVPGNQTATLTLPVQDIDPMPDQPALFARYRALLPATDAAAAGIAVAVAADSGKLVLRTALPPGMSSRSADFYPEEVAGLQIARPLAVPESGVVAFTLPITAGEPIAGERMLRGLLVTSGPAGSRTGTELVVPLGVERLRALGIRVDAQGSGVLDRTFVQQEQSLLLSLVFALIGGLLLNIMPCVLPVIALKIFGLVKMAGDHPRRVASLGIAFSAGIVASFLLLALGVIVLQAAGQQVGWGFQFQEPLFVIGMGGVVFAFGLSLFGVFEIRLPAKAAQGVDAVLRQGGKGYGASFLEGVFATILATPCTAPFLGAALGFAFSQPWWAILLIFFTVALGMALPYLVLTARPAWMKYLPKPGAWMVTAKEAMGFLMMGTLVWLLYILGMQLGVEGVVWTLAFLIMVAVACWLIGKFLTLSVSRSRAFVILTSALVLVVVGFLAFVQPVLALRSQGETGAAPAGPVATEGGVAWERFTTHRLEQLLEQGKPVLLDFTADWCLTCKVNERTVLAKPEIAEQIRTSGVVALRADWTNRNPEIGALLAKFGRSGVPLYVVFPAGDPTHPEILPEVITPTILREALVRATVRGR